MKIRIFKTLVDGVFTVRLCTEDWSEEDRSLMIKFGEPEINLGGIVRYDALDSSSSSSTAQVIFDDMYVRVMSESPFYKKFDSRDYGSIDSAKSVAYLWGALIESRIIAKIDDLRSKGSIFTTEEIVEH